MPEVETKAKTITVREAMELAIKPHELVPWEKMDPSAQIVVVENNEDTKSYLLIIWYKCTIRTMKNLKNNIVS